MKDANPLYVKVLKNSAKGRRVQIFRGSQNLGGAIPLETLSAALQDKVQAAEVGALVECEGDANDPGSLRPVPETRDRLTGNAEAKAAPSGAAHPNSDSGSAGSNFDENPFNFAEWCSPDAWKRIERLPAHDSLKSVETRHSGRISVKLEAKTPVFVPAGQLKADGDEDNAAAKEPRHSWKARTSEGKEKFGIPGSSVKGVVRSLFEALTNSRLGVADARHYDMPIPYRRRSGKAWVITADGGDKGLDVTRYDVHFAYPKGDAWYIKPPRERRSRNDRPTGRPPRSILFSERVESAPRALEDLTEPGWQPISWRANLLWTPNYNQGETPRRAAEKQYGTHQWTHLLVRRSGQKAVIPLEVVKRYRSNLRHAHFENHITSVGNIHPPGPGHDFYKNITGENVETRRSELADLRPGCIVFGILNPDDTQEIECFGKNVHFLWPSKNSPRQLAQGLFPDAQRTDDQADAVFGFVGRGAKRDAARKGMVSFSTFWADRSEEKDPVPLATLLGPAGVKLKARPLYLPPRDDGLTANYDEASRLRGRKFYWHQLAANDQIDAKHLAGESGGTSGPVVHPLPTGTIFTGHLDFLNLTLIQLGALLAALQPGTVLGPGAFGWKLGRGKPRGLGSVLSTCAVQFRAPPRTAYADLGSAVYGAPAPLQPARAKTLRESGESPTDDSVSLDAAQAYLDWAQECAGKPWEVIPFVRDLKRLLHIPDQPVFKTYYGTGEGEEPGHYGWMPAFESAKGEALANNSPQRRPRAMKRARDL